jgi:hypothetical protein
MGSSKCAQENMRRLLEFDFSEKKGLERADTPAPKISGRALSQDIYCE